MQADKRDLSPEAGVPECTPWPTCTALRAMHRCPYLQPKLRLVLIRQIPDSQYSCSAGTPMYSLANLYRLMGRHQEALDLLLPLYNVVVRTQSKKSDSAVGLARAMVDVYTDVSQGGALLWGWGSRGMEASDQGQRVESTWPDARCRLRTHHGGCVHRREWRRGKGGRGGAAAGGGGGAFSVLTLMGWWPRTHHSGRVHGHKSRRACCHN